jgi:hypothetical protein
MRRTDVAVGKTRARLEQAEFQHLDELLDEALKETFPASDSVAIDIGERHSSKARTVMRHKEH